MANEKETKTVSKTAPKKTTTKKEGTATKKTTATKAKATKEVKAEKVEKVEKVAATKKVEKTPRGEHKVSARTTRLLEKYKTELVPALTAKFNYTSVMQVPHLEKIVINIGVGDALTNAKLLEESVNELAMITGQHPVITRARKSIATFKLREGQAIGCKVTLRGVRMYEFFDKLVSIALPRVRDFRGVSKNAFDGHGNYTLGVKEQLIFPEITYDQVEKIRGMDVAIVTTAKTDEEARELLRALGMPFKK